MNTSTDAALGAGAAEAMGTLGLVARAGTWRLAPSLRYDGAWLPSVADLDSHTLSARMMVAVPLHWRLQLMVSPQAGASWYGDSDRNDIGGGGKLGLSYRLAPAIDVDLVGSGWVSQAAAPVFSTQSLRVGLAMPFKVWRGPRIQPQASVRRGTVVRYVEETQVPTADRQGSGQGSGSGSSNATKTVETFGTQVVAMRTFGTTLAVGLDVEQSLGRVLYVRGWADGARVWAEPEPYTSASVGLRLGAKW